MNAEPIKRMGPDGTPVVEQRPRRYAIHLDGHAPAGCLQNRELLDAFVRSVARATEMTIINVLTSNIEVDLPRKEREKFECGVSVQALIATSHIAIHTWPEHGFFMFDFVSCKSFNPQTVYGLLREYIGMHSVVQKYTDDKEK